MVTAAQRVSSKNLRPGIPQIAMEITLSAERLHPEARLLLITMLLAIVVFLLIRAVVVVGTDCGAGDGF